MVAVGESSIAKAHTRPDYAVTVHGALAGFVELYEVPGKRVLTQWFSYRKKTRERPVIGERRKPSPLGDIQPDAWLAEYTSELLNLLNVLGCLVELEPAHAALLDHVCRGPLVTTDRLRAAGVLDAAASPAKGAAIDVRQPRLFSDEPE